MFASQQTYGNRNHFRHGQWEDLKNPFLLPSSTINLSIYLYVLRPVLHTIKILYRSVVDQNLTNRQLYALYILKNWRPSAS